MLLIRLKLLGTFSLKFNLGPHIHPNVYMLASFLTFLMALLEYFWEFESSCFHGSAVSVFSVSDGGSVGIRPSANAGLIFNYCLSFLIRGCPGQLVLRILSLLEGQAWTMQNPLVFFLFFPSLVSI